MGLIGLIVVAIAKPKGHRKVPYQATAQTQSWQQAQQQNQQQQYMTQPIAPAVPQRPCPHCGQAMSADQATCPSCRQNSDAWRNQNGVWVTKQSGKEWWLNPQTSAWQMLRINKYCPNCLAEMQSTEGTCSECGTASNPLAAAPA